MDRLEEYIRKNRKELDKYNPSPEVWKGIRSNMHKGRRELIRWLSAAAMIVVILAIASFFYVGKDKGKNNPELVESEIYYNNLVNDLYNEATPLLTGYPDIEKELLSDLSQLDSICNDIKKDLRDNVDNQEVIEALINNYRIKTHILEDMLDVLKQNENTSEKNKDNAL
ncbi:MAG: hypothetical protein NTW82_06770 [Bacteroidia bacterium]|nr:hypothetical protein [Bacteroidia bacterium]